MITFEFQVPCDYTLTLIHKQWLKSVIRKEGFEPGDIYYLFCNDETLSKYNTKYLQHDTLTDIITFDETIDNMVSGSILISLDRVGENAVERSITMESELLRVVVHGVLHLCGYKDKTDADARVMRRKEDASILLFSQMRVL